MIHSYSIEVEGVDPSKVRVRQEHQGGRHRFIIRLPEESMFQAIKLHLHVRLEAEVMRWRNYDYQWVDAHRPRVANNWSPKILELEGGLRMVAGETHGTWLYEPGQASQVTWVLSDPLQQPRLHYDEADKPQMIGCAPARNEWVCTFLFTRSAVPEFSRSLLPFSAILNISDHCDFDSPVLLERQRRLLHRQGLRITKGVFLFHHSKRTWNVSFERQAELLQKWTRDGHELCYHSLSQSTRSSQPKWEEDFDRFVQDQKTWSTWIDHGFQPYNLSRHAAASPALGEWALGMQKAGVRLLWNYLDAGHSGPGRINQLNPRHFSLQTYRKSLLQHFRLLGVLELLRIYNLFFCGPRVQKRYQQLAAWLRKKAWKKSAPVVFQMVGGGVRLLGQLGRILFLHRSSCRLPKWQQMTPLVFEGRLGGQRFWFFQTVEVHDFTLTFSHKNIELLVKEAGVCLAHTYLADTDRRKSGRLFENNKGRLVPGAQAAFERLALVVAEEKLWMPTLKELTDRAELLAKLRYDLDAGGRVLPFMEGDGELPALRYV